MIQSHDLMIQSYDSMIGSYDSMIQSRILTSNKQICFICKESSGRMTSFIPAETCHFPKLVIPPDDSLQMKQTVCLR
jgi:hypothetical protein